jgi:DNA-binding PadR family transcriptional regulator
MYQKDILPMGREPDEAQTDGEGPFPSPKPGAASGAHKRSMYELFVLGELMDGPHHGYELREILSRLLGPFRQISWGIIYPLIRQLEREGLVTSLGEYTGEEREQAGTSARSRKPYTITDTGRQRFSDLMQKPGNYSADYRDLFLIKLNNFDSLSADQQLTVLWQYRGFLQIEDLYLSGDQQRILAHPRIPEQHRSHILRIMSFRWSSIHSEMRWIDEHIQRLEEETGETL